MKVSKSADKKKRSPFNIQRNSKNELMKRKRATFKAQRKKIRKRNVKLQMSVEETNRDSWLIHDQLEMSDGSFSKFNSKILNVTYNEKNNSFNEVKRHSWTQNGTELLDSTQKDIAIPKVTQNCVVLLERIPEAQMTVLLANMDVLIKNNNSSKFPENCKVCTCSPVCSSKSNKSGTAPFCVDNRRLSVSNVMKNRSASPFTPASSSSPLMFSNCFLSEPGNKFDPTTIDKDGNATYDIEGAMKEHDDNMTRKVSKWTVSVVPSKSESKASNTPFDLTYELASASAENCNTTFEVDEPNLFQIVSGRCIPGTDLAGHKHRPQVKKKRTISSTVLQGKRQSFTPLVVQKQITSFKATEDRKNEKIVDENCMNLCNTRHSGRMNNTTFEKPSKPDDIDNDSQQYSLVNRTFKACDIKPKIIDVTTKRRSETRKVKFSIDPVNIDEQNSFNVDTPKIILKSIGGASGLSSKKRKVTFSDVTEQEPSSSIFPISFPKYDDFDMTGPLCSLATLTTPKYKKINQKQTSVVTMKKSTSTPILPRQTNSLSKLVKTPGPSRTPLLNHLKLPHISKMSDTSPLISRKSKSSCTPFKSKLSLGESLASSSLSKGNKSEAKCTTPVSPAVLKPSTSKRTKMPDFASIHQKMFDKMVNIEEYSRRKSERAQSLLSGQNPSQTGSSSKKNNVILNNMKASSSKKQLKYPIEPTKKTTLKTQPNPTKVRGFDLTGNARCALKMSLNDPIPRRDQMKATINKVRPTKATTAENRTEIKGVRSNRRFELLMKMRQNKG